VRRYDEALAQSRRLLELNPPAFLSRMRRTRPGLPSWALRGVAPGRLQVAVAQEICVPDGQPGRQTGPTWQRILSRVLFPWFLRGRGASRVRIRDV